MGGTSMALLFWIYQHQESCYRLDVDSVCVRYGCDLFIMCLYDVCNCCASYVEGKQFEERLLKPETKNGDAVGKETDDFEIQMMSNMSTGYKAPTTGAHKFTITSFHHLTITSKPQSPDKSQLLFVHD